MQLHILGAVVWVGGMFAIYVCPRPSPDLSISAKDSFVAAMLLPEQSEIGNATFSAVNLEWDCTPNRR